MKKFILALALLSATPCYAAGGYDGYIEYHWDPPYGIQSRTYMGGSGIKYFHYGDYLEIRTPAGTSPVVSVFQYRYGSDPRKSVHYCINEQCNSEFWRRRVPIKYTPPRH